MSTHEFSTEMAGDSGRPQRAERPHLVIRPRGRWSAVRLGEIWEFRDLLGSFTVRDIRLRYRQTALGVIWVVLQPLLAAVLFAFVFGRVAHLPSDGVPYIVFAYTGQLAWQAFNGVLGRSVGSLVGNSNMISKIYFPRILLPLSSVGSVLLDFVVGLVVMVGLLIGYGVAPGLGLLLLPVWLLLVLCLATGIGLVSAGLAVRYRDVQYAIGLLTQFLLFASPVAYALASVPKGIRTYYGLNPLSGLLEAFRWSLLGRGHLDVAQAAYAGVASVLILVVGAFAFSSLEREFADVI